MCVVRLKREVAFSADGIFSEGSNFNSWMLSSVLRVFGGVKQAGSPNAYVAVRLQGQGKDKSATNLAWFFLFFLLLLLFVLMIISSSLLWNHWPAELPDTLCCRNSNTSWAAVATDTVWCENETGYRPYNLQRCVIEWSFADKDSFQQKKLAPAGWRHFLADHSGHRMIHVHVFVSDYATQLCQSAVSRTEYNLLDCNFSTVAHKRSDLRTVHFLCIDSQPKWWKRFSFPLTWVRIGERQVTDVHFLQRKHALDWTYTHPASQTWTMLNALKKIW